MPSHDFVNPFAESFMPDIKIPIGDGRFKTLRQQPDGSHAEVVAVSTGSGLVTDNTGQYAFDTASLASSATYNAGGMQETLTYGPDQEGRYIRQTSTWDENGRWLGDSAWQLVNAAGVPVDGEGVPL